MKDNKDNSLEPGTKQPDTSLRNSKGQFEKGNTPVTTFADHPENRHNGSWKKENTPRGRLEKLLNCTTKQELMEQLIANEADETQVLGHILDSALIEAVFKKNADTGKDEIVFSRLMQLYEFIYGRKSEADLRVSDPEGQPIIKGFVLPHLPGNFIDDDIAKQVKEQS